jgi:hypothetical protein
MGRFKNDGSALRSEHGAREEDRAPRPKQLRPGPRTPDIVIKARAEVSRLWGDAIERQHASTRVGAILWVSPQIIRKQADPADPHQVQVASVVALYLAGSKTLVIGFIEDLLAYLRAQDAQRGWPRLEHAAAIASASGAASDAARDNDPARWRCALHDVIAGAREALKDEESK